MPWVFFLLTLKCLPPLKHTAMSGDMFAHQDSASEVLLTSNRNWPAKLCTGWPPTQQRIIQSLSNPGRVGLGLISWILCLISQFRCSVVSDSLGPHGLHHARPPCPSPTPRVYSNPYPLSRWCHPTTSSSVIPFSHLQTIPASGSFQMSQFFASGCQIIGVSASASVLPVNIQDWFPLWWTGWISVS